jgi:hypothetical protein
VLKSIGRVDVQEKMQHWNEIVPKIKLFLARYVIQKNG